jgi:hypothetical protein
LPKPAFELTAKKLDPKAATASTKKVGAKASPNKTTTTISRSPAVAKKSIAAEKPVTDKKRVAPIAARRRIEHKKTPSRSSALPAKSAGHTGGRKPSPAIAKTNSEPSD